MPIFNSQVNYAFQGTGKPVVIGEGEDEKKLVSHEDFQTAMQTSESALGNKIIQDNAESQRLLSNIQEQALTLLDPGVATLPDAIGQLNRMIALWTTLVVAGKN